MELVTVFKTFNVAEAQLVCSRLQAAGLDAQLTHELAALSMEGYSMTTGGVEIQVPSNQVSDAKELIASRDEPSP
jgi:hypothetical protein